MLLSQDKIYCLNRFGKLTMHIIIYFHDKLKLEGFILIMKAVACILLSIRFKCKYYTFSIIFYELQINKIWNKNPSQ